jgi:hypothetical protein
MKLNKVIEYKIECQSSFISNVTYTKALGKLKSLISSNNIKSSNIYLQTIFGDKIFFKVFSNGTIYDGEGKEVIPYDSIKGKKIKLKSGKSCTVALLLGLAFIPLPSDHKRHNYVIGCIDGDVNNIRLENLEWYRVGY